MSPFVVDLAALKPGHNRVPMEAGPAELDLSPAEWRERIQGDLGVERTGEQVTVRGRVRGTAVLECVRCARTFEQALEPELVVYADRGTTGRRVDEERELARDDYMKFHDGRHLDLRAEAREVLLLDLPIAPRCREECRGLCPRCGADLNEGPCACTKTSPAPDPSSP